MLKRFWLKRFWLKQFFPVPVIFIVLLIFSASQVSGKSDAAPEVQGKMDKIINLQTVTLQKLFAQEQKIASIGKEKEGIVRNIEILNRQIAGLQISIAEEEMTYARKKEDLKQLLRSYQRMGPGSYLEIILESNDLHDFLRRINVLRDITGNTGKMIEQLQRSKEKLAADKIKLSGELTALEGRQAQFDELLAKEKRLKQDLQDCLASLSAERDNYQKYLDDLQTKWSELKPLFSNAVKDFSRLIEEGKLPPESFKLTANFLGIKGSVSDKALNEAIAGVPGFPQVIFSFAQENVEMKMPDKNLVLDGTFVVHEGNALKFQVKDGSFYGIPLETDAIQELFRDGDLLINLKSLLNGYTLNSVETMNGYLQFSILPEI